MRWTGGQYSVHRAVLGLAVLVVLAARLLDEQEESPAKALAALGALASLGLAIGYRDRRWVVLALPSFLAGRALESGPWLLSVLGASLLVLHAFSPPAPYGSFDAAGRTDPSGGWELPAWQELAGRILASAFHLAVGILLVLDTGSGPLGDLARVEDHWRTVFAMACFATAIAPFAGRAGVIAWAATPALWITWSAVTGACWSVVGLTAALVLRWFRPSWFEPRARHGEMVLYYDGHCGFCHRWVRAVLAEDVARLVRFAPLQGPRFATRFSDEERSTFPDSIVLEEGSRISLRSEAAWRLLDAIGGLWRPVALLLRLVPGPQRDLGYSLVARVRRHLFATPSDACPIVPKELRERFVDE